MTESLLKQQNPFTVNTNLKVDTEKCEIDNKYWAFDTRGCQIPTTPLLQPEWGVVVHNIDSCDCMAGLE